VKTLDLVVSTTTTCAPLLPSWGRRCGYLRRVWDPGETLDLAVSMTVACASLPSCERHVATFTALGLWVKILDSCSLGNGGM
jgi:hypothetical protein